MSCIRKLLEELNKDKYAIIGNGLSDLYYLPIRISKLIGWAATAVLLAEEYIPIQVAQAKENFRALLKISLENYTNSIVAVSDEQTSSWIIATRGCYEPLWAVCS